MAINFDLKIETDDNTVDMKTGLESMLGISDTIRCVSESILTNKVPRKQTHKSNVRTTLKKTFKGSYGHIFSLDIYSEDLLKKLDYIGKPAFIELIDYFINEALYLESKPLSKKATKALDNFGKGSERLIKQLRVSALRNIHAVPIKFDYDIIIRHRESDQNKRKLASFSRETAKSLQTTRCDKLINLEVGITRLNIRTGNGRLQIKGQEETTAFGFEINYDEVSMEGKKIFSENLDNNNGLAQEAWSYLKIGAISIQLLDGKVVKYLIQEFNES